MPNRKCPRILVQLAFALVALGLMIGYPQATYASGARAAGMESANGRVAGLRISAPWSKAMPPVSKVGATYLVIENDGQVADRLLGGSTDLAASVEVHSMAHENGVMIMKHLEEGLELPAGSRVELAPGGYHIMLIGLTRPMVEGEGYVLILEFERAGKVELAVPIRPIDSAAGMSKGHHKHGG